MSQSIEKVEKKRLFEVRTNNNKQRYQFCGLSFCIFLHDFVSSSTLEIESRSTVITFKLCEFILWNTVYNGKIVEWPLGCNSHGDHLMGWKSRQDLSNRNIYSRGKRKPFLLKINTYIVYMAYFYPTRYHTFPCFVHGEIRCAIAGDQVMGMRQ